MADAAFMPQFAPHRRPSLSLTMGPGGESFGVFQRRGVVDAAKSKSADAVLITRIVVALIQGAALYLTANWRNDEPLFGFDPETWRSFLEMARTLAVFAPLPLYFGLGRLPGVRLALWTAIAAAGLAFVGWLAPSPVWMEAPPVVTVWLFSLIVLYIVHEFLQAAHDDGRPVASYETYFDVAWRHAFQAALALAFTGAFWIVLNLGAFLFELIGVAGFGELVRSDEFAWPASTAAFALGVHLTDAGSVLTRGARQIGLALLSWLAVLFAAILTAFLAALPFTGLEPLWDTKRATVLLLNAAATMILLINAAFQAGDPPRSRFMRAIVRLSALPLAGVVALAAIGLWLRVDQYGWTPARVVAGAEWIIVAFYAAGYLAAALSPGAWMALIKPVNIAGALIVAAILLGLMTPVADPARLSVADQIARLETGRVEPDDFDFAFLADPRSRHWGEKELTRLAAKSGSARDERIAYLARNPGAADPYAGVARRTFSDRRRSVILIGDGAIPDAALLAPKSGPDPVAVCASAVIDAEEREALEAEENRRRERLGRPPIAKPEPDKRPLTAVESRCRARLMDLDADGADDDLLLHAGTQYGAVQLSALRAGAWETFGSASTAIRGGASVDETLARGLADFAAARALAADRLDLVVDGSRTRHFPPRAAVSAERIRAAVEMTGAAAPPAILLDDRPLENLAIDCAATTTGRRTSLHDRRCFGRYIDATGDGAEDFLLLRFTERYDAQIHLYAEEGDRWAPLGAAWSEDARAPFPIVDEPLTEAEAQRRREEVARIRGEIFAAIRTSPPIIVDLDYAGERLRFGYPKSP